MATLVNGKPPDGSQEPVRGDAVRPGTDHQRPVEAAWESGECCIGRGVQHRRVIGCGLEFERELVAGEPMATDERESIGRHALGDLEAAGGLGTEKASQDAAVGSAQRDCDEALQGVPRVIARRGDRDGVFVHKGQHS